MEERPKYSAGDKFIIEIGEKILMRDGTFLYRIKGFNSLVFDQNGLDRLKRMGDIDIFTDDMIKTIFMRSLDSYFGCMYRSDFGGDESKMPKEE